MTAAENGAAQPTVRPATGWLSVEHGEVHLGGAPSASETTRLALQAAVLTTHAQPSVELLDWFMAHRHQRLTWDKDDTPALVRLLRSHEPRGWNLLERTGVLARALPEIGAAIRRRRADITNVDPVGALRFRVAERLDDLAIEAAIERLRLAPVPCVLSHTPDELASLARLSDPLPEPGCVRVAVASAAAPDQWKIDVACRDSDALLAHLTDVLSDRGLDIVDATIGTWPDGGVLDTFVVFAADEPNEVELTNDFESSLRRRLCAPVVVGLIAEFNNEVLPWHTVCDVKGPDQPGALLAISAAFASAAVVVHTARIATVGETIRDRFTVSDRHGRKLDDSSIERGLAR